MEDTAAHTAWERRETVGRLCDWCRLEIPFGWFRAWTKKRSPLGTFVCNGCRNGERKPKR